MLLRHPWLTPLLKPPSIAEEEEEAGAGASDDGSPIPPDTADKEVAAWASEAMQRRGDGKIGKKTKPALHAAPLDAVPGSMSDTVHS